MEIVTVVIPTYKRMDSLPRAIMSVLEQTYKDVEVIVVDDNDADTDWRKQTSQMMEERFHQEPRVKYICHAKNMNGSAARNTGLMNSTGVYICFLDDDDYYQKDKIEKQVAFLKQHPEFAGCYCDCLRDDKPFVVPMKEDFSEDIILCGATPQTSGWLLRTEAVRAIGGFDTSYRRHQDYEFLLRFYEAGYRLGKVDEVLYVMDRNQVSNVPHGAFREEIKRKYLGDFHDLIMKIDQKNKGFYKRAFTKNMSSVLSTYIKAKDARNSIRIWNEMCRVSFGESIRYVGFEMKRFLEFKFHIK